MSGRKRGKERRVEITPNLVVVLNLRPQLLKDAISLLVSNAGNAAIFCIRLYYSRDRIAQFSKFPVQVF